MADSKIRIEHDFLGEKSIPADALYGIHAVRASENFPSKSPFPFEWYKAMGLVKLACLKTVKAYEEAVRDKLTSGLVDKWASGPEKIEALIEAAREISHGLYYDDFIVPAVQGGAGTSINMNINEILANAGLQALKRHPGEYDILDPLEDANRFQSTNDVVPTALKVAAMFLLQDLEATINALRASLEDLEKKNRNNLRIGYTQMQEAVPTSFGKLFGGYNDALSRDWWRVSKCFERIKEVNLGGGAAGTGLAIPRFYIMHVVSELQKLTGLPVTRSEHLPDTTSNLDSLVEIHATLKAHAVNLEKLVGDIRLLASDIANPNSEKTITIPNRQTGSSMMPGKVNPVIPEFVISAAHKIYANDQLISSLAAQGSLELNAYIPVIGDALLESLKLLIASDRTLQQNLISGLTIQTDWACHQLMLSPSITTALIPYIGYHAASAIARIMKTTGCDIFDGWRKWKSLESKESKESKESLGVRELDFEKLREILKPENLLKLGYTLKDLE